MQQQAQIIKGLLKDYINEGGDVNDLSAATAYINQNKPEGCGQVSDVITKAIFKLMGHRMAGASVPIVKPPLPLQEAEPAANPRPLQDQI